MRRTLGGLVVVLLLAPGDARGAPSDEAAVAEARRHNARGEKLFNLGLFEQAAEAYHRAYLSRPIPAFLYNIGQCYWRMGGIANLRKALFHYESFRNSTVDPDERRAVDAKIAEVRGAIEHLEAAQKRPPPIYKRWWFWTLAGVVVAGATTGLVLGLQPEDQRPVEGNARPGVLPLP